MSAEMSYAVELASWVSPFELSISKRPTRPAIVSTLEFYIDRWRVDPNLCPIRPHNLDLGSGVQTALYS